MNFSKNLSNCVGVGLFILSVILLLIMLFGLNTTLWDDTLFSTYMASIPFKDIIPTTLMDVHPPLYYLLLKISLDFFHLFSQNITFSILWLKLFSTIPILLLFCFGFVRIKKDFGCLCFGIFTFSIVTMPKIIFYATDIRMYTWTMLFLTLSFYYSYLIIKKSNNKNWIIFTFCSLLASYTHYFATITIFFIYLYLLLLILKNKTSLKNWILSTVTMTLSYIPWIFLVYRSTLFSTSNDQLWVRPTFQTIIQLTSFIFSPIKLDYTGIQLMGEYYKLTVLGVLLFVSVVVLLLFYMFKMRKTEENFNTYFIGGGIFLLVFIVSFGLLFSFLIKPIFNFRYVIPVIGCFWLSFSILLAKIYSKKIIFVPILILILLVGITNTFAFIESENYRATASLEFNNYTNQINENDTIIFIGGPLWSDGVFKIYFPDTKMIVWNNKPSIIKNISMGLEKGKVWIFDMDDDLYDFNNLLLENDLRLVEVGEIDPYFNYPHCVYLIEN
jgi:hypothetical protein